MHPTTFPCLNLRATQSPWIQVGKRLRPPPMRLPLPARLNLPSRAPLGCFENRQSATGARIQPKESERAPSAGKVNCRNILLTPAFSLGPELRPRRVAALTNGSVGGEIRANSPDSSLPPQKFKLLSAAKSRRSRETPSNPSPVAGVMGSAELQRSEDRLPQGSPKGGATATSKSKSLSVRS
jgi:hypothetical protein